MRTTKSFMSGWPRWMWPRRPGWWACGARTRQDLVRERTRCLQRVEKLLEDAMIKITSVAKDGMKAKSVMAMVAALIAGERDPRKLADLAKGPLRGKRARLAEALDGMFG